MRRALGPRSTNISQITTYNWCIDKTSVFWNERRGLIVRRKSAPTINRPRIAFRGELTMPIREEPLPIRPDERGFVFEPADESILANHKNLHIVWSVPGAVRGNHYHLKGTETIIIVGPALMRVRDEGVVRDINIPSNAVHRFTIPPGVSHAVQNTGDQPHLLVAFNTREYLPDHPDFKTDMLIDA
jgi:dTDP-4-dehydrorhamnose 3,5-epimerase-like enzyme